MNGCQSSTELYSERQYYLQRVSDFHAVLLSMAAHDLRQPLQVIQSTYEWLSGRFDDDVERMRLQRGERAVSRLAEQLDRLAAACTPLRTDNVDEAITGPARTDFRCRANRKC